MQPLNNACLVQKPSHPPDYREEPLVERLFETEEAPRGRTAVPPAEQPLAVRMRPATLAEFIDSCEQYFDAGGSIVEQPYQERLPEGMKRVYLTHDRVVGFTQQFPRGLVPPGTELPSSSKVFEPPEAPAFQDLRERAETEWVPELQRILGLEREHFVHHRQSLIEPGLGQTQGHFPCCRRQMKLPQP